MVETKRPRPVVLCILDGWGYRTDQQDNAIAAAKTPTFDALLNDRPYGLLDACELEVGLPKGQMGNSEVGHTNLGAGRVVMQDLPRIDTCIADGKLAEVENLKALISAVKQSGGVCHIAGLLSPGGVHSHQDHLVALAKVLAENGVEVRFHAYLDGRDTPPSSAAEFMAKFEADIAEVPGASVATVTGRYYAMDRDQRWDRVELAYNAMVAGEGIAADSSAAAIQESYAADETDEFVKPRVIAGYQGMKDGDAVLIGNFRADRVREISAALLDADFDGFARKKIVTFAKGAGLTQYSADLAKIMDALFPPQSIKNSLGEVLSAANMKQLRIAETEKYAHVTFFFNGGEETVFEGEERILVPSPKVATYDLQPEMSAAEVTDKLVEAIQAEKYDAIIVNYANTDMVGHTGILEAAVTAVEAVDSCLARLISAVESKGGAMLVTADHGNAELMVNQETGQPHTAHTLNKVPLVAATSALPVEAIGNGRLADVAPTLLSFLGLEQPEEMTGQSLVTFQGQEPARAAE